MALPSPSPSPAPRHEDDLLDLLLTTHFVDLDGYTVLVSRSMCSVQQAAWAWVCPPALRPPVTDWSNPTVVHDAARRVLAAFHRVNRGT